MTGESAPGPGADNSAAVVEELAAVWARLGLAGEVEQLVDLYSDDAIFFGSLPAMFAGRSGVAQYFRTASLSSLKSVRFDWQQVTFIAPTVISAGGLVFFGMEVDRELLSWRFGIVWVLVRSDEGWKIAAHHASPRELP